eukprot:s399_g6.t1
MSHSVVEEQLPAHILKGRCPQKRPFAYLGFRCLVALRASVVDTVVGTTLGSGSMLTKVLTHALQFPIFEAQQQLYSLLTGQA